MDYCIDEKLLNEVCTIKTSKQYLVGQILKIYKDKFAVSVFPLANEVEISNEEVEIRIETLDNQIYFYVAFIESQHELTSRRIIFFKPISEVHENNKRKYKRLKLGIYSKTPNIFYRIFPPIESKWEKVEVIDISQGGLQVKGKHYLSKGQLIEVKIGAPFVDTIEVIISRIVNIKKENDVYIYSIQFLNLTDTHKQSIENYINIVHEKINNLA
ncbi:hypothetical protein BHF71_07370 [Vulcanibacillus modesticaldus]|uniref:PilZ domain-containing protein n=1 Tax=Vulcanibacillus modesticaldus TaxID=337097 RepID=A0A1D2YW12_9BACI|nr:PilZ domain-containing protein [Vulcanibacillus modesticaldus]OEF99920.1 hypothetical protein BHF71_07370 [Vulcanibacillus modesticaldus]